jgi:acetyl-CoA synthetase
VVQYDEMYKRSVEDPDGFWGDIASTFFWKKKFPVKGGKLHSENIDVRKGRVAVEVRFR